MVERLKAVLTEHAIALTPSFDGQFQRNGSQWGKGTEIDGVPVYFYGDFKRDLSLEWIGADLTPEQEKLFREKLAETKAQNRAAREEAWSAERILVGAEWESFSTLGESNYAQRKGFKGLYGCRIEPHPHGARLIVPARDASGKLWGYQRIYSERLSEIGTDKLFRKGARKEGCFHTLGELKDGSLILVAEGISTAVAIYESLERGFPVVSVFDAGNLAPVAHALRAQFPNSPFRFCADDDRWPNEEGKIFHTGQRKAEQAAKTVGNAAVVLPYFTDKELSGKPTDFWDLWKLRGDEAVKDAIFQPRSDSQGIAPVSHTDATTGKPKKPSEKMICKAFLDHFGDDLLKQGRDLFIYRDGYWQHQDEGGRDRLKQLIGKLYGPTGAGIKDIENAFRYILVHAPTAPSTVDLFVPPSFMCNFQNGTLHIEPGEAPKLSFRPHSRTDYATTQLPFDFPGLDKLSSRNAAFDEMLERIFRGDPDQRAKVSLIAQIFGAALIPCYAKIFFLVGPKGCGKSTILKLLHRLCERKNVAHVDPSHFHGFHMESLVGKMLNMVTDIDLHKPINDSVVKQITDRIPFRVARKFQTDLLAPLPPIHIFGGNDLPKSLEGSTGAYERRVIIVRFGESKEAFSAEALGPGGYRLDFDESVWRQGREGILAFALRGLVELVAASGHYTVPASSADAIKEWDSRSDIVAQFLDALAHGELDKGNQYTLGEGLKISRKNLWEAFDAWQKTRLRAHDTFAERQFCGALRSKGFSEYRTVSERGWVGIGAKAQGDI